MTVGAAAVLATLWRVNDLATALLTAKFCDLHLAEGQPLATALRHARLRLWNATRDELAAYPQGRLGAAEMRQLEQALDDAAAEERFFDIADTPGGRKTMQRNRLSAAAGARSPIRRIGAPWSSLESNAPRAASNQGRFYFGNPSDRALRAER